MALKIINVVGARPNFVKISPLMKVMIKHPMIKPTLIHTGQHYDGNMARVFFEELELPRPDVDLGVAPGPHAAQTAEIMRKFEQILKIIEKPDVVVVVGDVNSTIACALTSVKMGIPVAHIEAGLRSFNWEMPEEINRILTDRISELLFVTERGALENLKKEGINESKIHFVGNIMIDSLLAHREVSMKSTILKNLKIQPKQYAILTLHRSETVDKQDILEKILEALSEIQSNIKIIWPIHPRTKKIINKLGLGDKLTKLKNLLMIEPASYLDFLHLMDNAKLVMTDSGGIQEETTVLDIDCLTLRGETERPVTVEQGTNVIVGTDKRKIILEVKKILQGKGKAGKGKIPELWDGKTAERIVKIILKKFN